MLTVACAYARGGSTMPSATMEHRSTRVSLVSMVVLPMALRLHERCKAVNCARRGLHGPGQLEHGQRDDLGRVHEVGDVDVLIRLVREIEDPGSVGDAVRHARDPREMFLVVGAWAGDEAAAAAEDAME